MNVIYEPKGKAKEYAGLACNLYKGCEHGCVYCYAPSATFVKREAFYSQSTPRKDIIKKLKNNCKKINTNTNTNILLSFTSDCYQPIEKELEITKRALEIFSEYNLSVSILTKGGLLATRDFDVLKKNKTNEFAVTLTTDSDSESLKWEPKASFPNERIESLLIAKRDFGLKTWVSFEPVFNPEAVYRLIEKTYKFTDFYKVGKMNHHPISKEIDWQQFGKNIILIMKKYKKPYIIKKDLQKYI